MIKATAAFEQAALRPPFLLNGGALAVYFAFYGALIRPGTGTGLDQAWAKSAWILWIIGVVAAAVATFAGYRSQFSFRKDRGQQVRAFEAQDRGLLEERARHEAKSECYGKAANRWRIAAHLFVIASIILFIAGVFCAFASLPKQ